MTRLHPDNDDAGSPLTRATVISIGLVAAAVVAVLPWIVGVAAASGGGTAAIAAQNNSTNISDVAPYYANASADVNNESWMAGAREATLPNMTAYLTRVGGFVIGSGYTAQGGVGAAGPLLLALVVVGMLLRVTATSQVGSVGGGVVAVAAAAAIVSVGIAPTWLYPVVLFGLGLIAAALALRIFR